MGLVALVMSGCYSVTKTSSVSLVKDVSIDEARNAVIFHSCEIEYRYRHIQVLDMSDTDVSLREVDCWSQGSTVSVEPVASEETER